MVNKAVVGIIVAILVASLAIGGLVASQLGGSDDPAAAQDGGSDGGEASSDGQNDDEESADENATATPTDNESDGEGLMVDATPTESAGTPTPTPTETRTTVPPHEFNETLIALEIAERINDRREEAGLQPLSATGTTSERLDRMATNHSRAMAKEGAVVHVIDGNETADRYQRNGLFSRCSYEPPETNGLRRPNDEFEVIGSTIAGQYYERDGEERINRNESAVAQALVGNWYNSTVYSERLRAPGQERMGVGIAMESNGETYATVHLCG